MKRRASAIPPTAAPDAEIGYRQALRPAETVRGSFPTRHACTCKLAERPITCHSLRSTLPHFAPSLGPRQAQPRMAKQTFFCIDAHTCGNPVRVVAGGGPPLKGATMS